MANIVRAKKNNILSFIQYQSAIRCRALLSGMSIRICNTFAERLGGTLWRWLISSRVDRWHPLPFIRFPHPLSSSAGFNATCISRIPSPRLLNEGSTVQKRNFHKYAVKVPIHLAGDMNMRREGFIRGSELLCPCVRGGSRRHATVNL